MHPTVSVYLCPEQVPTNGTARAGVWVVADVVRASTSICAALAAGAPYVRPCLTPAEAVEAGRTHNERVAGEQNRLPFVGAELGNSPQDFTAHRIMGRGIALCTTNGTRALHTAAQWAHEVAIGGFSNTPALHGYLQAKIGQHITVLAAGWKGQPCVEDTLFAGWLCHSLASSHLPGTDSALLAQAAYTAFRARPMMFLRRAASAPDLLALGLKPDVRHCIMPNPLHPVPVLTPSGLLRSWKPDLGNWLHD
jgi:2-phosphosulfolactate phosphatase